ncbi:pilus assembly protein [Pseudarthrobacter sp. H3Y2-7]|uniref:TadE/TadG family type IV pilus assembly protein n=1 Tax=Pseudarthrobacter naphthalenicus TaxID=3031328 RepID=UPI0023B1ED57|nr:TadE family protein [Pseudarthrobacter sp. H3Y2-7]MDE8667141.1 pilus assembly protein [Pseudarthrobacter sp. H3Y2-7]
MKRLGKHCSTRRSKEIGAVAVEFALILPIFLALILGIVEYGRAFSIQVSMAEGAREAARYSAIHYSDTGYAKSTAQQKAVDAAPIANLKLTDVDISACAPNEDSIVTISVATKYLTGLPTLVPFLPDIMNISAKGVMRCGG